MEAILYSPDGQPVACQPGDIRSYLQKGYKTAPPQKKLSPEESRNLHSIHPVVAQNIELTGDLDLNTASPKELAALPQVGTAVARKIKEHRPYKRIEDLIANVPEVDWLAIKDKVKLEPVKEVTHASNGEAETPVV